MGSGRDRGTSHRRGRNPAVSAGVLVLALLVTWVVLGWNHIITPSVDAPQSVDAVFVIGPAETRMREAMGLMEQAGAPLLLSTTSVDPETGQPYPRDYCGLERDGYRVDCVVLETYSTRGEAQLLGARAQDHGWTRVAIVTSTPHAARARLLMQRCTDAEVVIWAVDEERGLREWAWHFVYQSAAWVKTQVVRDC